MEKEKEKENMVDGDIAELRAALNYSTILLEELQEEYPEAIIKQIKENRAALSKKPRNCDRYLSKDLIGAVTLYCVLNKDIPPMVEWNTLIYTRFCKWLFSREG